MLSEIKNRVEFKSSKADDNEGFHRWRQEPLSGYLVHGSNGEFAYLSPKERVDVIRVVKEEVIFPLY